MSIKTEESSPWRCTTELVKIEITLTLVCRPPMLLMVFPCLSLLRSWWRILACRKILWVLQVMMVAIFDSLWMHWIRNTAMNPFLPPKTLFTMECLAHVLVGICKAGLEYIKSDDGEVDTKFTRQNMQKCITWKNKSQKGAQALLEAQLRCGINENHLPTPVSTSLHT